MTVASLVGVDGAGSLRATYQSVNHKPLGFSHRSTRRHPRHAASRHELERTDTNVVFRIEVFRSYTRRRALVVLAGAARARCRVARARPRRRSRSAARDGAAIIGADAGRRA